MIHFIFDHDFLLGKLYSEKVEETLKRRLAWLLNLQIEPTLKFITLDIKQKN